jgi:hypothetical protein
MKNYLVIDIINIKQDGSKERSCNDFIKIKDAKNFIDSFGLLPGSKVLIAGENLNPFINHLSSFTKSVLLDKSNKVLTLNF